MQAFWYVRSGGVNFVNCADLLFIQGGVEEVGDAVLAAVASGRGSTWFLHQGDQGADDDRDPFTDDGGQLVAKAFPPPVGMMTKVSLTR